MKKLTTSIALLTFAGVVAAQSTVSVFGTVDISVGRYSLKSENLLGTLGQPASVTLKQTAMGSGNLFPSRWGFRGTEDLGGGYSAGFWFEYSLSADEGTQPMNARRTTVSLNGPFGELRFGRDFSPTFMADALADPFYSSGVGTNIIAMVNSQLAIYSALPGGGLLAGPKGGPANYVFVNNTVNYFTPKTLGGFYAHLSANFAENIRDASQFGSPSNRGRFRAVRLGYAKNKFDIATSYASSIAIDALPPYATPLTDSKITTKNLTATYDLDFMKISGEISRATNDSKFTGPIAQSSRRDDYDGAMMGISVPLGPASFKASYGQVRYKTNSLDLGGLNSGSRISKISLGVTYFLSKRTQIYATAAYLHIKDGQNNPTVMGVAPSFSTAYATNAGFAPRSASGYELGVIHSF